LREVWCADVSQALWENIGGFERIQQAAILFAVVRELENEGFKISAALEGAEVREAVLRVLRRAPEFACASLRSESIKQRNGEFADTLQVVPQLSPCNGKEAWTLDSWEDGIARVANGIPSRVDRLKGLGNAVVPAIPELIGRAILNAERNAA
jgi:site-specific DNA-cytosine methylase